MKYDESEPSGFRDREDMDWPDGVHIRQEDRGVLMYAVFDGEEQASEEYGPLNDNDCLGFAEGYASAKERYDQDGDDDE